LYSLMTALILVYFTLSIALVAHTYRHPSDARQRTQTKFWLLAIAVSGPFDLTNLLPVYGINVYPLGSFGNALYLGVIAYAIARHRLMDVDYVVRKAVSFFLAASAVLVPGGLVVFMLGRAVGAEQAVVVACAAVALALLSVVLIPIFQEALETRVHRAFFRKLYDYRRRLQELAAALVHLVDRSQLIRRLGESLTEILDVDGCEIFVPDDSGRRVMLAYPTPASAETLSEDVVRALEGLAEPVLASELERANPTAARLFNDRGWEVGIPLRVKDRLNGFIGLGQKKDFRIFSGEDLQLLSTVATGATVALENASLSRQLRRWEANLPSVSADPDQLKQIVLNLLLNAIESSSAGGHVMLDVHGGTLTGAAPAVVVEVQDRGPGIPADQLEHIFHPFYTTKETGTGLGLALVHQMVVDHGGEIAVDSTPGQGTHSGREAPACRPSARRPASSAAPRAAASSGARAPGCPRGARATPAGGSERRASGSTGPLGTVLS